MKCSNSKLTSGGKHEVLTPRLLILLHSLVMRSNGFPDAAPAPSKNAGLHGLCCPHERQHVLQYRVRQCVDPIANRCLKRRLPPAGNLCLLLRHFVEQLGGAGAENWMEKQNPREIRYVLFAAPHGKDHELMDRLYQLHRTTGRNS